MNARTLLPLTLTLGACSNGGSENVADFQLTVTPVTPINQAPFDGLERMVVVVEPSVGDPVTYELSSVESGSSPKISGVAGLDEATIALEGYAGGKMVSFGRSDPISLLTGSFEARVLVSNINDFAWFNSLEEASFGGAMATDGGGHFFLFGGNTASAEVGDEDQVSSTIWGIDVAPPDESFALAEVGTLPEDADGATARMALTATLLTVSSSNRGKILLAGGQSELFESSTASNYAYLWDPDSATAGDPIEMVQKRFFHSAVENQAGQVVIVGGFAYNRGATVSPEASIEVLDPDRGTSSTVVGTKVTGAVWPAVANLGPDGVLICGGVGKEDGDYTASDECAVLSNSGELSADAAMDDALFMSSLAPLGDGRALLTGGFIGTGLSEIFFSTEVEATAGAWIYDNGTLTAVEDMHFPRAGHGSAALPDGRVVIFGGVPGSEFGIYPTGIDAIACAEVFDPETEKFNLVGSCSEDDDAATLPTRTTLPAFAADPLYGVMVAGGLNYSQRSLYGKSADGAALYVSCPEPGKC